jgi:hypothetical protein
MPPPFSKEVSPIDGVIEEERSSEEEVLGMLLLKSLFLKRPWKSILQPTHDKQK